jgi:hypothetical protein
MMLFFYVLCFMFLHCVLFALIYIYIACMVKSLVNKSYCQINKSNTIEGQPKGWAVLGA